MDPRLLDNFHNSIIKSLEETLTNKLETLNHSFEKIEKYIKQESLPLPTNATSASFGNLDNVDLERLFNHTMDHLLPNIDTENLWK